MPELHLATEDMAPLMTKMKKSESELSPIIYFDQGFSPSNLSSSNTWKSSSSFGLLREAVIIKGLLLEQNIFS